MMIPFILSIFMTINPTVESIQELKAKEEKGWNRQQSDELESLNIERKRLQAEIQLKKEEIQTLRLKIVDRKATGHELLSPQMELQHLLYSLQCVEEEILAVKERIARGMYGDILTRKRSFEE